MSIISSAKSLLFLPAHRLDRFETAKASGANMVCMDLQDGLPDAEKDHGREAVKKLLQNEPDVLVGVRVNSAASEHRIHDVKALRRCPHAPHAVILPLIEHAREIETAVVELGDMLQSASLIVMMETVNAICGIDSICAACPPGTALLFGNADMSSAIGCANDWENLACIRSRLIMFAAKWKLPVFDGVTIDLRNEILLEEECSKARKLGFAGKAAVHPRQVKTINRNFCPTGKEIDEARAVVAAYEAGSGGAIRVGDKMVDRPVYLAAVRLLKTDPRSSGLDDA
jgi:(S)-citramalyl-CoA lyase